MSLDAMIWAVKDAPVDDVYQHSVLVVMADEADEAGCTVFLAVSTIAERCRVSERKVQRVLADLLSRRMIGLGDQTRTRHIRGDHRPVVYDLLIPYRAFANVDRVNRARLARGQAELTPDNRPDIADPSPRPVRADAGTTRRGMKGDQSDGVSSSHPATGDGVSTSHPVKPGTGCLPERHGVTTKSSDAHLSHQVDGTMAISRGVPGTPDPIDPVINPPTRARVGAREAGAVPTQKRGEGEIDEGEDLMRDLAEQLMAARGWSVRSSMIAMRRAVEEGRTVAHVLAVMSRVGADMSSQVPARLLAVPGDWWLSAAGAVPKPAWCGHCDQTTRLRTHQGQGAGKDRAVRCPDCHPLALEGAA